MKTIKTTLIIASLASLGMLGGCLVPDPLNQPFSSSAPKDINDGHIISDPGNENMDAIVLTDIYEEVNSDDDYWSLRSLLVFRHGKLVSEAYFKDESDITTHHLIWSCTKQVMGILAGIALDRGVINDLDDPISDYFDQELDNHQDKAGITINDLLTMRSGIGFSNDGTEGQTDKLLRQIPENSTEFILALPMAGTPGVDFAYKDGDPQLFSALLQKQAGKPTDEWADDVLFSEIGVTNYNWVRYKDGITFGGFGIETTPRELAKIALCVADSGRWNGMQVIPENWIKKMLTTQVEVENFDYDFCYYWWLDPMRNIQFMWGHGGQFAFIIPEKDIVVVMTSIPNTQGDYQIQANEALPLVDRIIGSCN